MGDMTSISMISGGDEDCGIVREAFAATSVSPDCMLSISFLNPGRALVGNESDVFSLMNW